ncbi:MAG TPA: oxidoreductase [Gammaproteobacteria bacterium]|nr:oxidoreductase [Gammaproteobacteria bacterium]
METFRAFRIHKDDGGLRTSLDTVALDDLSAGEVVIRAAYSSVNYKDALAATGRMPIARHFPLVGGIDVTGTVVHSADPRVREGQTVVATGGGMSETRDGGYAAYARVPIEATVALPDSLSLFEAAAIGTAGFTAALAVDRMENNGQRPELGPVLVTGATGGVGSFAVDLLSGRGYEVVALTGKSSAEDYLARLGADRIVDRHRLEMGDRPLEHAAWGGAVDSVGGDLLAWITRTVRPWGSIASIGLAGGTDLHTTVLPFILRGVSLLGIESPHCPRELRERVWKRLASDLRPRHLDAVVSRTVTLDELEGVFAPMLEGALTGRVVVQLDGAD